MSYCSRQSKTQIFLIAKTIVANPLRVRYRFAALLTLGTTFAGYTLLEKLAEGGMAIIYLARNIAGDHLVLRVLRPQLRFNWTSTHRFRRGCETLSHLDHPNIVHYFSHGIIQGQHYNLREYVDGANLKELIFRNDPLLAAQRLKLLLGMASGLSHIHERGYIHLDFKPENIMLSHEGTPKIIDFDLSIPRPTKPKRASSLSGTPAYLAPEQILRQPVDERADIFAFGLTAYEMISGKKPVTADNRAELFQRYTRFDEHFKPLHFYVPNVPATIEQVIFKCLEKDPSRRYPSMSLVLRDLQS